MPTHRDIAAAWALTIAAALAMASPPACAATPAAGPAAATPQVAASAPRLPQPEGRRGHSLSVLADGRVLALGGLDRTGAPVSRAEVFDEASKQFLPVAADGLIARVHHRSTVLPDGRVLISGGVDGRGALVRDAELWNPTTGQVERVAARLDNGRQKHQAVLLPQGDVLVWGGVDPAGATVAGAELFDAQSLRWRRIDSADAQARVGALDPPSMPVVYASTPSADARDAATRAPLVVRFAQHMDAASFTTKSVTLIGPNGAESVRAVAVEQGLLLFVWPQKELLPASRYTLFVNGAADTAQRRLALTAIGFDTAGGGGAPGVASGSAATAATSGTAQATAASGAAATAALRPLDAQLLAQLQKDDELFVPEEQHRKGHWLSDRADRALATLPRRAELRRLLYGAREYEVNVLRQRAAALGLEFPADGKLRVASPLEGDHQPAIAKLRMNWADMHTAPRFELPAAPAGTTALAGQVLRLNGKPLANVTLKIGTQTARTDDNGEFLLTQVQPGAQVLAIDGASASRADARYGYFEHRLDLKAGKTNLLPFVVWMPKLDTRHTVRLDTPTRQETVVTHPLIPGLELRLPAGTVLRTPDGKIVNEIGITPVPVDQTPFPMPYFGVPVYFTVQPGGALIQGVDSKPKAATLRYPNYGGSTPGDAVRLFDYDPKGRGWYTYAQAKVSEDGQRLESGHPFQIYQFTANSASSGGPGSPGTGKCKGKNGGNGCFFSESPWTKAPGSSKANSACSGDPVELGGGRFIHTERDLFLPDTTPIDILRTYRTLDQAETSPTGTNYLQTPTPGPQIKRAFGIGTTHPYEIYLYISEPFNSEFQVVLPNGRVVRFLPPPGGTHDTSSYINTDAEDEFRNAYLHKSTTEGGYILYFKDGRRWGFTAYDARVVWMEDANGARTLVQRMPGSVQATRIVSPNGRYVDFTYADGLISQITDNGGRSFHYAYDAGSRLTEVTDPAGKKRIYGWDIGNNRILTITDPNGNVMVNNEYEAATGRVKKQTLADGSTFQFAYFTDGSGRTVRTEVTDRRGSIRRVDFDAAGNVVKNTFPLGKPEEQVTTFELANGLTQSTADALGRKTAYVYDSVGNIAKVTQLAGTADAISTQLTWDSALNRPLTVTDPNGKITRYSYDAAGNLLKVTDPLNIEVSFSYDPQGRLTSMTDGLKHKTTYTYDRADLSTVTDALSRKLQLITDSMGRTIAGIEPMGQRTTPEWDSLNRLTQITDALGQTIRFTYDDNGNLLTHVDKLGSATTYTYNGIGRVASKQDALLKTESSLYEPGGGLKQRTDRMGQVSGIAYDARGRVKMIGFGATVGNPTTYASTIALTWDQGDRLTHINDSAHGLTTRTYDLLNRMTREVTPQGEVNYTYDKLGRKTSMLVKNGASGAQTAQPKVLYSWDAGSRLTLMRQLAGPVNGQAEQSIAFTYDKAYRRTQDRLANGTTVSYSYDNANQISAIQYKRADASLIGDLIYTYDANGRRTSMGGSLARAAVPASSVTDATHNANNQLTRWAGKAFNYDANGNLIADGTSTYQWDERNQLKGISAGVTPQAAFQYGSTGRRVGKTLNGVTTGFLYGGLTEDNFVQELLGTSNTAGVKSTVLTGGVDETFLRESGGQLQSFLIDGNNNTLSLTDAAQAKLVDYAYEPYGKTTADAPVDNSQQYTGRENDGVSSNGLYYYRARYYMPACGRFISEDPIGWASGQANNYAYVAGDPVDYTDPSGNIIQARIGFGALVGAVLGGVDAARRCHNWGDIALGIAAGAVSGAIQAAVGGMSPFSGMALGAGAAAIGNGITQLASGKPFSGKQLGFQTTVGGITGLVGWAIGTNIGIGIASETTDGIVKTIGIGVNAGLPFVTSDALGGL